MLMVSKRTYPWIVLAAIACLSLVVSNLLDAQAASIVSKLLASTAFLATAVFAGALKSRYGRLLFVGLVLSWFGDAFLLGTTEKMFLFGLATFLLAHVAYVIAFAARGMNIRWALGTAIPIALVSIGAMIWLTPWISTEMLVPVRVYTLVISLMVITAFGTRGNGGPMLIPIGALLFYCSDLSVAVNQFMQPAFPHYVWGLPFYYTGQIMLALSTAFGSNKD
ncbi:MAG: lysoplasmalogenase [Gammaproteobacteria bacterium]|nr:MAG: lysoplasmalogenase [Gammaproteobacteria bacterium]RLA38065.1 MAG: lysoplasmalogenase [Gammaproteobacteria bacterium]